MTFIPLTRCASLAASARTHNRPHPIACVQPETVELAHQLMYLPVGERRAQVAAMAPGTLMDVMIALDRHAGSAYELWRDTPAGFAEDILGLILDDEQRAVLDAAAADETRRIAARGPHPDNHVMAAALMAWAALVSGPRGWDYLPRVAVSFAQYRQTSASVWRVLARFIDNASLPGRLDMARRAWWADGLEGPQRVMAFSVPRSQTIVSGVITGIAAAWANRSSSAVSEACGSTERDIRSASGIPTRAKSQPTSEHAAAVPANFTASRGSIRSSGRTSTTSPVPRQPQRLRGHPDHPRIEVEQHQPVPLQPRLIADVPAACSRPVPTAPVALSPESREPPLGPDRLKRNRPQAPQQSPLTGPDCADVLQFDVLCRHPVHIHPGLRYEADEPRRP